MKTKTLFLALAAVVSLGLAACSDDDNPTPVSAITLDQTELSLEIGGTAQLTATIAPAEAVATVEWSSSDDGVATVNTDGLVTAVAPGEATITAKAGEKTATCAVTVKAPLPAPVIGDFYYSDGTWSTVIEPTKTCIGIVFWVGDPTATDAALRREHPDCNHGLVIALDEENPVAWMENYETYGSTASAWIKEHVTDYEAPESGNALNTPYQTIIGYNNTKALEAFNAASENAAWPVNVIEKLVAYRSTLPAPKSSSDWYVPSPKELSLAYAGELEGSIYVKKPGTAVLDIIVPKITEAGGATPGEFFTWTSTEPDESVSSMAWEMAYSHILYKQTWPLAQSFKNSSEYGACRFVLAF